MREILFRGKRIDNGEWVEGFLLKECNYVTCSWNLGIEYKTDKFGKFAYDVAEVDVETIGQYTGKTDKNGTKIFEGDIIQGFMDYGPAGYLERVVCIYWNDECGYQWNYFLLDTIEVIGNEHDNPELLRSDNDAE